MPDDVVPKGVSLHAPVPPHGMRTLTVSMRTLCDLDHLRAPQKASIILPVRGGP
jgi:hypothetical protein